MCIPVLMIEDGPWIRLMVRCKMAVNDFPVLAVLVHLVNVLWRQPGEAQHGGYGQPRG
jgi:hypothetical protein